MKPILYKIALFSFLFFLALSCSTKKKVIEITQPSEDIKTVVATIPEDEYDSDAQKKWVDSIYNQMTLEEKIGQLFMIAAYSNKDSVHVKSIEKLITDYKVGGLIFFQGGPVRQAKLTNRFQSISKTPLFIGIDAEWGLSMRLDSTYRYPWNMTLGAIQDKSLIEKVGIQMAEQNKRIGVHFNFAPVLDINTNPKNPIIGFRSFGEDKCNVTESALALMTGYQSLGLLATGKHFPGHGDTDVDSHSALPTINFSKERLDSVEVYPYKKLFKEGLSSVMVAHLNVPSLEPRYNSPSSISYKIVTLMLKDELKFKGLIFTDALNMKAASNYRKPGVIDLEAFQAGNDILLFPENVPAAVDTIKNAYINHEFSDNRLAFSVKKILKYKYKAGLNQLKPIEIPNIYQDINKIKNEALQYKLYENAVTIVKNENDILPITNIENNKIAYIKFGDDVHSTFLSTLKKYTEVTEVNQSDYEDIDCLNDKLKEFNTVIVGFHKIDKAWKKDNFTDVDLLKLKEIAKSNKVILDVFVKPYSLTPIDYFEDIEGVMVSYQNSEISQIVSAEIIFGAVNAKGKLPVSINETFKVNDGIQTKKIDRLGFTVPENVDMSSETLSKIDNFANYAINNRLTPGIQVLVARKGKVVFQKAYGYQTYDKKDKITNSTIYDVASLTKILATLPNVMKQYDNNAINMQTTLGSMLPIFNGSDKENINFKDLMSHYAGFQAWEPFYKATLDNNNFPSSTYYKKTPEINFTKQVADSLFIRNDYHDTIMKKIVNSKLSPVKEYKYSDFTFIILKDYLERVTNKKLEDLIQENFFSSLGMNNSTFNPLKKFSKDQIPPTEVDTYFRHQVIKGYVHDMEAAMEGGVGGHAGLFSNSMDVAKMMQLFLQKGSYGNQQYFSSKTFDDFNTCYFCTEGNRRGIGFDKQQLPGKDGPTCGCASMTSFGHTGFTGTMAWVDPEEELVYVFLSNRTYPDSSVNKLSKENIREDIQKVIYEAIIKK
ncbi:MAG TPA: glycoside hydrolase family 3 N-terminal domain-containing protein [Flavobacterium sp.]|nr:glycoside hydrolase family 3 N-terminal domain-containing protein [Flavobacterium sp.]